MNMPVAEFGAILSTKCRAQTSIAEIQQVQLEALETTSYGSDTRHPHVRLVTIDRYLQGME